MELHCRVLVANLHSECHSTFRPSTRFRAQLSSPHRHFVLTHSIFLSSTRLIAELLTTEVLVLVPCAESKGDTFYDENGKRIDYYYDNAYKKSMYFYKLTPEYEDTFHI